MALHVNHGLISGETGTSPAPPVGANGGSIRLWGAVLLFSVFEFACIHNQQMKLAVFSIFSLTVILGIFIIAQRYGLKLFFSLTLYACISLLFSVGYVLGQPVLRWISIATVFLVPIIYSMGKISFSHVDFPAKVPLFFLVAGFVMSWLYQACKGEPSAFGPAVIYDVYFTAGIAVFYAFYFLLSTRSIILISTLKAAAVAGIPFILVLLHEYAKTNGISAVFHERLGLSIPFGPNFISSFFELLLPLSLFIGLSEKRGSQKVFFLCLAGLYGVCTLACYSRGSLPGLFCLCIYLIFTTKNVKIRFISLGVFIISLLLFGVGYLNRILHPDYIVMLSNAGRVELFKAAIKTLQENHYFFGIGMNSFSLAKFQFGFPHGFDYMRVMSSHNQYLELWMGWGLAGLCGWGILVFGTMFRLLRIKLPRQQSLLRIGVLFSLFFFMTHGIVDSIIGGPETMFFVFVILSCSQYLAHFDKAIKIEPKAP